MNEFEAPPGFVKRVMDEVREYERDKQLRSVRSLPFLIYVSAVGGLLGAINMVRLFLAVFSTVPCR